MSNAIFKCSLCKSDLEANTKLSGAEILCSTCGSTNIIPGEDDFCYICKRQLSYFEKLFNKNFCSKCSKYKKKYAKLSKMNKYLLNEDDILAWWTLINSIKEHNNPAVKRVWEMIPPEVQKRIEKWQPEKEPDTELKNLILESLNEIIANQDFYQSQYFNTPLVKFNEEISVILEKGIESLSDIAMIRLNRLIIQAIFLPGTIEKVKKTSALFDGYDPNIASIRDTSIKLNKFGGIIWLFVGGALILGGFGLEIDDPRKVICFVLCGVFAIIGGLYSLVTGDEFLGRTKRDF